jgi:glycolate oxidase FAD binding subunit
LFGGAQGTLGGAVSADASGAGRLRHGPARDSLLGFRAVNGFGQAFRGGSKVVKNVTGFDLPKLVCGAFGTLMVLSELTFRVYPRPSARATLMLRDLAPDAGFAALRRIWQSALEPSGLAYIPGTANFPDLGEVGQGAALIRFEAAAKPLSEKLAAARLLVGDGEEIEQGEAVFTCVGEGTLFRNSELDVWRVTVPPSEAARVAAAIASPLWLGDWAGGLLWIGARAEDAPRIRSLAAEAGGHAMLLRAPAARTCGDQQRGARRLRSAWPFQSRPALETGAAAAKTLFSRHAKVPSALSVSAGPRLCRAQRGRQAFRPVA